MKKSKKDRNGEIAEYTSEQISKLIAGFIPGTHLLDFWKFRTGLKQKRLLDFAESLKNIFENELNIDLDIYNFESEDFVDLFDSIMNEVQSTKSQQKLDAFKSIFVNALISDSYDLTQVYIDLTSSLYEKQIEILLSFIITNDSRKSKSEQIKQLSQEQLEKETHKKHIEELARNGTIRQDQSIAKAHHDEIKVIAKLAEVRKEYSRIIESINPQKFGLEESEYDYFVRDLVSKGLLIENTSVSFSSTVVESIDATNFALTYYKFIVINV